jgi:hypothetical protein
MPPQAHLVPVRHRRECNICRFDAGTPALNLVALCLLSAEAAKQCYFSKRRSQNKNTLGNVLQQGEPSLYHSAVGSVSHQCILKPPAESFLLVLRLGYGTPHINCETKNIAGLLSPNNILAKPLSHHYTGRGLQV